MSTLNELFEAGKRHHGSLINNKGKILFKIPLLLVVILIVGTPQLLLVVLVAMLLEIIEVEYDGRPIIL
jgi:hypothetical protein